MANFSVNTNAGALIALQNLNITTNQLNRTQNTVNTGLKVASAKDNAAVFAIAQSQRADLGGLNAVKQSLDRANSTLDVGIAAAEAVADLLIDLKEKAVAAKDAGLDTDSRGFLNDEFVELRDQITTIVENAEFNGINVVSSGGVDIVAIVNDDGSSTVTVAAQDISLSALSLATSSITTSTLASGAVTAIDAAIGTVNTALSKLGAGSRRLSIQREFVDKLADQIEIGIGNLVDADLARESATLQALQVKQQLGLQALSIANQAPAAVLSLFN